MSNFEFFAGQYYILWSDDIDEKQKRMQNEEFTNLVPHRMHAWFDISVSFSL